MKAEVAILKGPDEDLESFLDAVDLLKCNIRFFSTNKISTSEYGLLNHANNLLSKAVVKLRDEFRQLLATYRYLFADYSSRCLFSHNVADAFKFQRTVTII